MATSLARYMLLRNVRAFLWALRYGEGTQGPDGYRTLVGGKLFAGADGVYETFDDFADHPRQLITVRFKSGNTVKSTAAGAYQFLSRTWDEMAAKYALPNFEPPNQDLAAVGLIIRRGAIDDIVAGRIEQAVLKCNKEWASLPGSPYGQPRVTMEEFKSHYEAAGGLYVNEDDLAPEDVPEPTPLPEPATPPAEAVPVATIIRELDPITQETIMPAPIVTALAPVLLPSLIKLVPQLTRLFGSGSEVSQRNAAAVDAVFQVAKEAIGARNEQEVVESVESDPAQAQAVKAAIEKHFLQIEEAGGGGIEGAREFNRQIALLTDAEGHPVALRRQPAFVVTMVLLGMVIFTMATVLIPWELWTDYQVYSDDVRLIVVTAMITGVLSAIVAFWLGSSFSSRQKDNTIAAIGARSTDRGTS